MPSSPLPNVTYCDTDTKRFTIVAIVATILATTTFAAFPHTRIEFVGEDRSLENLTVCIYALAVLIALLAIVRRRFSGAAGAALIAFAAALGALEELSWGERYFELQAPVLFGVKIDAIHDLLHATIKRTKVLMTSSTVAQVGIVIVAVSATTAVYRLRATLARLAARALQHSVGKFLMITAALGVFALFLDLVNDVQKNHDLPFQGPVVLGEELCEALASLSLLFGAWTQARR